MYSPVFFSAPMIGNMRGVAFLKVGRQIRDSGVRKSPVKSSSDVPADVCENENVYSPEKPVATKRKEKRKT